MMRRKSLAKIRLLITAASSLLCLIGLLLYQVGCKALPARDLRARLAEAKPTLSWPPPPNPPRIVFLKSFYGPGDFGIEKNVFERLGEALFGGSTVSLLRPVSVATDKYGSLYIVDAGAQLIHVYDNRAFKYYTFGKIKTAPYRLESPVSAVVDDKGFIYVSDSVLRKVFKFDSSGKNVSEFGGPDTFLRPTGLALSRDGNSLYVVDTLRHKIFLFDLAGGEITSFGQNGSEPGAFNFPTFLTLAQSGDLIVSDSLNFRIQVLEPDGTPKSSFGQVGDGTGDFARPKGLAVDSEGHIYVADSDYDNIQVFDTAGNLLLVIGANGIADGEFVLPVGLSVDANDYIYVADSHNQRIQVFRYLKGESPVARAVEP